MNSNTNSVNIFASVYSSAPDSQISGGYLVCLGVPEATEFGLDYEVFRTGPKFQGVKFVPLGLHLVIFRSCGHEHGIRQGFFINVERHGQVLVREWSNEAEELQVPRPGLNIENLENAVHSFQLDSGLGAYQMQHFKVWSRMTKFISKRVLIRCGIEFGALLLPGDAEDIQTTEENRNKVIPYFNDTSRTIHFTSLEQDNPTKEMTAEERTLYHFDKSTILDNLISSQYEGDWKELLGELQLAFVTFFQLSSLAALNQWKKMLILLCSCERALTLHSDLFIAFVKVLRIHLLQIPIDFFEDAITAENFLRPTMMSFLELLMDGETPIKLRENALQLQQLLHSRFNIDFNTELFENAEFAPLVIPCEELVTSPGNNEEIALAFLAATRARQ